MLTLVLFVVGLGMLIGGADVLLRGATRVAFALGISPLVVGLTVVALCTSAPELAVTVQSGLSGQSDLALGNVVGSNVANTLLILGVAATITPLLVQQQLVRQEVPLVIVISIVVFLMASNGTISKLEGTLLVAGIAGYTVFALQQSRRTTRAVALEYDAEFGEPPPRTFGQLMLNLGLIFVGLALLVLGSRWLVNGAVALATLLGVDDLIIGLTIVSIGTSLPELATSVIAAMRGERDIAVGNVLGSNIYNLLAILGTAALVTPGGLPVADAMLQFDLPVLIVVAVACLPVFFVTYTIRRWEGIMFLGYYAAYMLYLVVRSVNQPALSLLDTAMLFFVIPLTIITFVTLSVRAVRAERRAT